MLELTIYSWLEKSLSYNHPKRLIEYSIYGSDSRLNLTRFSRVTSYKAYNLQHRVPT